MSRFDLIIFDCDGTLVNSEVLAIRLMREMMQTHGLTVSEAEAMGYFSGHSVQNCLVIAEEVWSWRAPAGFADSFQHQILPLFQAELGPVPNLIFALDHIALPKCVASNSGTEELLMKLDRIGVREYFPYGIFGADHVDHPKPAPDLFLLAAERNGVEPSRCAVIEDSMAGLLAGAAAGMTLFAYMEAHTTLRQQQLPQGALCFHDMAHLPALLQGGMDNAGRV